MKTDVYQQITDQIIASLEAGVSPWTRPWTGGNAGGDNVSRPLRHNGEAYAGVNVLVLWLTAANKGYHSNFWMTFNQAREYGAFVRKGEKGTQVVYANRFTVDKTNEATGETEEKSIPFLKAYTVFNADQIDGLPEKFQPIAVVAGETNDVAPFFTATGADIRHGGDKAFYSPSGDFVQMPPQKAFKDSVSYNSTLAHELVHWSGGTKRLDRIMPTARFGDEAYAMEELVAEIGSAFVCADLGIALVVRDDHARYLASWLKVLKGDKKAIFTASSAAQKAVAALHAYSEPAAVELKLAA